MRSSLKLIPQDALEYEQYFKTVQLVPSLIGPWLQTSWWEDSHLGCPMLRSAECSSLKEAANTHSSWWDCYSDLLLFSRSAVSDSLWPHGLQHARIPCPSLSPRVCSNSCPLSSWCYLTILSSDHPPFSFCLQSFPASGSFPVSWLFTSGGQSIGASHLWSEDGDLLCEDYTGLYQTPAHALDGSPIRVGFQDP